MNIQQIISQMMPRLNNCSNKGMVNNFMQLYQNNDAKGIEQMARNILQSNNITLEQAQQQIMSRFR